MANEKMTALCIGSNAGRPAWDPLHPQVNPALPSRWKKVTAFSIMTRAENDSEQDFSKKALVQRNGSSYQCAGRLSDHPG